MSKHEFGIMPTEPKPGERFDRYEPEKYDLTAIDDESIEPLLAALNSIDFYWHTIDIRGKGLAYCGITLIPPESIEKMLSVIENECRSKEMKELKEMLKKAKRSGNFVIHYGI